YLMFLYEKLFYLPDEYIGSLVPIYKTYEYLLEKRKIIFGIFGVGFSTIILIFSIKNIMTPISNLSVGITWLGLSLLYLESKRYLKSKNTEISIFFRYSGYLLIITFFIRHIFVDLQSNAYLGIIPVRFLIEFLALGVVLYWYFYEEQPERQNKFSFSFHESLLEISLVIGLFLIDSILPANWKITAWSIIGFVLYYLGIKYVRLSRMLLYSIFIHIGLMIYIGFILSSTDSSQVLWMNKNWFSGIVTIILQTYYVFLIYKNSSEVRKSLLKGNIGFKKVTHKFLVKKDWFLFYPYFFGILFFLFWSFDNAILTLLWTILGFGIFILSIVLKKNHFRYSSFLLIISCIIRLIFHDMSSSETIIKAIVFLGVGAILVGMNMIYNRYKDRF
ncbi:MAG: DUF2339 domain-containing protein, partial [Leptospiraceae bacterium]|nr:DUF2339 domain-containing protein [Leptospiraceae bacterium]